VAKSGAKVLPFLKLTNFLGTFFQKKFTSPTINRNKTLINK